MGLIYQESSAEKVELEKLFPEEVGVTTVTDSV